MITQTPCLAFLEPLVYDVPMPKFGEHGELPPEFLPTNNAVEAASAPPPTAIVGADHHQAHLVGSSTSAGLLTTFSPTAAPQPVLLSKVQVAPLIASLSAPAKGRQQQMDATPKRKRGRPRKEQREK